MPLSEDISGAFSDGPCWQKDKKTGRRGIIERTVAFALNKRSLGTGKYLKDWLTEASRRSGEEWQGMV